MRSFGMSHVPELINISTAPTLMQMQIREFAGLLFVCAYLLAYEYKNLCFSALLIQR